MTRLICRTACCVLVAIVVPLGALTGASSGAAPSLSTKELLSRAISELSQADAFSFHAEILRDRIDST